VLAGKSEFTLELRIHIDASAAADFTLLGQRDSDVNRTLVIQRWASAFYLLFDGYNFGSCAFAPCPSETYHLALVYNGAGAANSDRLAFYIDGVAQAPTSTGTIPATTLVTSPPADLVLGCEHNGPSTQLQYMEGQIGELCIWDRVLTPTEISARVATEVVGTETGLVEYFHFDDGTPGGTNTGITSFAGGLGVSTITPVNMAMTGAASNFEGPPALVGGLDVSVTQDTGYLMANEPVAIYQWLDCDNGFAPIPLETYQYFFPLVNGTYAVALTAGACTDTSACITVGNVGIAPVPTSSFAAYPNPVADELVIEHGGHGGSAPYRILNAVGAVVRTGTVTQRTVVPLADLAPGVYTVQVGSAQAPATKVIVKL